MKHVAAAAILAATIAAAPAAAQQNEPAPEKPRSTDALKREGNAEARVEKDLLEGKRPPELPVTEWFNLDGSPPSWTDLEGKVVLLKFWGAWCGPCRSAMPHTTQLARRYADRGLVVLGIHTRNAAEKMRDFLVQHEIDFPVALDAKGETVAAFAVDSYPDYYLIDRKGILRLADLRNDEVERAILMLLDEDPERPFTETADRREEATGTANTPATPVVDRAD